MSDSVLQALGPVFIGNLFEAGDSNGTSHAIVDFSFGSIFIYTGNLKRPIPWNYLLAAILDLLIANVTQIFYGVRLWKIIKRPYYRAFLFIILGSLLALNLALDISHIDYVTRCLTSGSLFDINFKWAVGLAFGLTSVIDCILSVTLVFTLYKTTKRVDWTDNQFYVVLAYVVNSGALPSLFSITCPFAYIFLPNSLIFLALRNVLTALYFNSLLAMLNAQQYLEDWGGRQTKDVYIYNGSGFRQRPLPSQIPKGTINEVGLPLFDHQTSRVSDFLTTSQPSSSDNLDNNLKLKMGIDNDTPLEVNVVQEAARQSDPDSKGYHSSDGEISEMPVSHLNGTKVGIV
ncbi:hypothetical protein AAF712_010374 [Marasmius tenuissimus]|uniref:DUF6534 domain-containing protein n=1 Tax=Marasmius tenuissimus TaxID=585030 RepID=A0ABR2ZNK5_9AGAR